MPHTLLLADDSTTIQRVVSLMFADQDIDVVAVGRADQALDALAQRPADIILADVDMPGGSGYQLVERVRQNPATAHIPVLLLAGAFEPVDEQHAAACGANGVLTKPFDPATTVTLVHALLTAGSMEAARRPELQPVPPPSMPPVEAPEAPDDMSHEPIGPAEPEPPRVQAPPSHVDRYFDELEQAFAGLSKLPRPPVPPQDDQPALPGFDEFRQVLVPVPVQPVPVSDAFAALLDAERGGHELSLRLSAAPVVGSAAPPIDVNALADQIASRVLEQLTDRVVKETVADVVATTAERLVREEIERIKRNIK